MILNFLFLIYSAVSFFYSYVFFHLGRKIEIRFINLTFVIIALVLLFFLIKKRIIDFKFDFKITSLVGVFCILCFGFVWLKFENGLRFPIVSGWDSAAHFSMMRGMIEEKSHLLAGSKPSAYFFNYPENLEKKSVSYPPGFYIPSSLLALNIINQILEKDYLIFLINWFYFVQIFMILLSLISFIYILKEFVKYNKLKFSLFLGFFYTILFFYGLIQLINLGIGFASFIAFFFYFNLAIFSSIKLQKENSTFYYLIYLISLYLANASWFLPVFAFTLFAFIPLLLYRDTKKIILLILYITSIVHFSYWHIIPKELNFSNTQKIIVKASGGVQIFSLFFDFLTILSLVFFFKDKYRRKNNEFYFISIFVFMLYLLGIAFLQIFSSGKLNYYFYKSFLIWVVMIMPIGFYFISTILNKKKIWLETKVNNWKLEFKIYQISKAKISRNKILDINILNIFLVILMFIIAKESVSRIGISEYKNYFKLKTAMKRETYNALLIVNDIFNVEDYMLAVFPPGPSTTLWAGALYGRNLPFFDFKKHWENWVSKEDVIKDRFLEWVGKEKSQYKILVVDTECWFSKKDREEFKKANNRVVFYNPGCVD